MAFRDLFKRRLAPPAPHPVPPPVAPIALARAPAYQPVPTNSADPVDAEIVQLWIAYQRQSPAPTWPGFLTSLTQANTDLAKQVARLRAEHADYRRMGVFTP